MKHPDLVFECDQEGGQEGVREGRRERAIKMVIKRVNEKLIEGVYERGLIKRISSLQGFVITRES